MRELKDIPHLNEAIQFLSKYRETEAQEPIIRDLQIKFGYNPSIAYDVLTLWIESLTTKTPITFLAE